MALEGLAFISVVAGAVAALALLATATLVGLPTPRRPVNIALAVSLLLLAFNAFGLGLYEFIGSQPTFWRENVHFYVWITAMLYPLAYLVFLGRALVTPLVRPFRSPIIVIGISVLGLIATFAIFVLWPPTDDAATLVIVPALVVLLFSLTAAIDSVRRAQKGTLARRRARSYLIAFAVGDVGNIVSYGGSASEISVPGQRILVLIVGPILLVASAVLIARALLRDQLFDFDLKLKLNVKRGTIAAVFLAVFFVVAQLAQNFLSGTFGWLIGGVAAGLLLFAIAPLQRAAERVASAAVPGVVDSPEYRLVKKQDVYRAAVEGALEDGVVTDKERSVLARLADQLGLSATETLEIERDVARKDTLQPHAA